MLAVSNEVTSVIRNGTKGQMSPIGVGVVKASSASIFELEISPADAAVILRRIHPKQREPIKTRIKGLLATMRAGAWYEPPFTADSIAFDTDGYLVNGRHRMAALAQYDKPLRFFVMFGVRAPDDMPLPECDNGLPRSAAFVEGVDTDGWAVAKFIANAKSSDVGAAIPRLEIRSTYDLLLHALLAIPAYTGKQRQPTPIRAGFVFQWLKADAIERVVIEEQWRIFSTLYLELAKPGIAELYRALQRNAKGHTERYVQFAQTLDAIERIDEARRLSKDGKIARGKVKAYFNP